MTATMRIPLALFAMLAASPVGALASVDMTGDEFIRDCTSTDPNWRPKNQTEQDVAVHCAGYIEATVNAVLDANGAKFCIPDGSNPQDLLIATISFMRDHAGAGRDRLFIVMTAAARAKWPCTQ